MAAYTLAKKGYIVNLYEKQEKIGGILTYGIPEFRLDKKYIDVLEKVLKNFNVNIQYNFKFKSKEDLEELKKKNNAVLLSFGANVSSKMGIEGEDLNGVYGGNELLENKEFPDCKGKKIAIIGGGNVAMDVSRTLKRLGADKVSVIYRRRSENEMPAEKKEIEEAKKEGIEFQLKTNILSIKGNNKVEQIECIKTDLIKKEGEQRLSPVNIEGTNFTIKSDYIIMAVGSHPESNITTKLNLELDSKGKIIINEKNQTSNKKIFAGGDITNTEATVAFAASSGRNAAINIIEYLNNRGVLI